MANELMTDSSWWFVGAAVLAGIPVMRAPALAKREAIRLIKVADRLKDEAISRGAWMDQTFELIFHSVLSLATCAPMIASDNDRLVKPEPSDAEVLLEIEGYLDKNGWLLPYLATTQASLTILISVSAPYNLKWAARAFVSGLILKLATDARGLVRIVRSTRDSSEFIEKIDRTYEPPGNLAHC